MGFDSFGVISKEDIDKERQSRLDRKNPPDVAHGQDDSSSSFDDIDIDALFGNSSKTSSGNNDGFSSFGSSENFSNTGNTGGSFGGFNSGFNTNQPNQQTKKDAEDIFFETVTVTGKGLIGFLKQFVDSFKGLDAIYWSRYGATLFKLSGIITMFTFLITILGLNLLNIMIGSGVATVVGVIVLSFTNDKARSLRQADNRLDNGLSQTDNDTVFDINHVNSEGVDGYGFSVTGDEGVSSDDDDDFELDDLLEDENEWGFEDESEDEEFEDWGDWGDDEDKTFSQVNDEEKDINEVLNKVDSIPTGMHTRQFLYDSYMDVLTRITPEYSKVVILDEDDEEWDLYSAMIREAQDQMGLDSNDEYEDDLSEIISVEKRFITIKIEATRPKRLSNSKVVEFDKELTNLVSIENGEAVEGRYTKSIVAGSKLYTTIFLGDSAVVSVKDALEQERDFFLDSSNKIPAALGFDHLGNTVKVDMYDIESIITAGMPRGGKSFSVKTVMSQMLQFSSPKEIEFYFIDVKDSVSDWYEFKMPHVKRFVSEPKSILALLTHITEVEASRRERLFSSAGVLNYKQYKKLNPDAELPLIYVVIDEMTTLSEEFNKEDMATYKSRLVNIVTKMPSYGVRLWGIPHVIKNEIIPKTVSDTIDCRISVKGDANHIETTTGAKPREFPYRLTNVGDCAVRMTSLKEGVFFMHAFVLASNDEGISRVVNYQTNLWSKLDPESVKTSYAYKRDNYDEQRKLLDELNAPNGVKDIDFSGDGLF